MPYFERYYAQQFVVDLCPWAEFPSSINNSSTPRACVIKAKALRIGKRCLRTCAK
jgi:hypothetical protein